METVAFPRLTFGVRVSVSAHDCVVRAQTPSSQSNMSVSEKLGTWLQPKLSRSVTDRAFIKWSQFSNPLKVWKKEEIMNIRKNGAVL